MTADILDIVLASIPFLTAREKICLKKNLDSIEELAVLSIEAISQKVGRVIRRAVWDPAVTRAQAERAVLLMEQQHIGTVLLTDAAFPALLREIPDPPYALFYRGRLEALHRQCVSVVGTRRVCGECAAAAQDFAREAVLDGLTVVSGNAEGIDFFAHRGALLAAESNTGACGTGGAPGATAAVLPCGIDTIVPVGHKALAARILRSGGVIVAEYIPGCPAEAWRFVQRNRIIAALSPATVVVQAPPGSGALITADFAVGYSRDVLFHKSCFCAEAAQSAQAAKKRLEAKAASSRPGSAAAASAAAKLRNSPERYVADGAPVIASYAEYRAALAAAPGGNSAAGGGQGQLF